MIVTPKSIWSFSLIIPCGWITIGWIMDVYFYFLISPIDCTALYGYLNKNTNELVTRCFKNQNLMHNFFLVLKALKYDFTPSSCILFHLCHMGIYVRVYQRFFAAWTEAASPICGMWAGCYFLSAAHVLQSFCAWDTAGIDFLAIYSCKKHNLYTFARCTHFVCTYLVLFWFFRNDDSCACARFWQ